MIDALWLIPLVLFILGEIFNRIGDGPNFWMILGAFCWFCSIVSGVVLALVL